MLRLNMPLLVTPGAESRGPVIRESLLIECEEALSGAIVQHEDTRDLFDRDHRYYALSIDMGKIFRGGGAGDGHLPGSDGSDGTHIVNKGN